MKIGWMTWHRNVSEQYRENKLVIDMMKNMLVLGPDKDLREADRLAGLFQRIVKDCKVE